MSDRLPERVKVEVKTTRTTEFALCARDIEGISPDGYSALLVTARHLSGPRWVLVPARLLVAGTLSEKEAVDLTDTDGAPARLVDSLNATWSDWVLDPGPRDIALAQETMTLQESMRWCLREHPPRHSSLSGAVREGKLARALENLRDRIDETAEAGTGPQQEGFVHQILLEHGFRSLGYDVTNNPVGVPDFNARLVTRHTGGTVRERLENWKPTTSELQKMRDRLLELEDSELLEAEAILRN